MTTAVYGLEPHVRALCAVHSGASDDVVVASGPSAAHAGARASPPRHALLVATAHAVRGSKLHLLAYDDTVHSIECAAVWPHPEQLQGAWTATTAMTGDGDGDNGGTTLCATATRHTLRVLRLDVRGTTTPPREVLALPRDDVQQALWDVDGMANQLLLLQRDALTLTSLDADRAGATLAAYTANVWRDDDNGSEVALTCAVRDTHSAFVCYVGTACGALYAVDVRAPSPQRLTRDAQHGFGAVRSLDCSATTPHRLLSGGDDGDVVVHDMRGGTAAATTLLRFAAHEHAVCRVHANSFHDELVLSAGADHALRLWDVSHATPTCLAQLDDYGDSVVDACWSATTPWVYAGISHTGKLLIDHVPDDHRLRILLAEH